VTSETEEMGAFWRLQLERASDARQNLGRHPDVPALFEPGVPGEANAGEVCDLFSAQAGRPAAGTAREADTRRRDAGPATLEEVAQLRSGGSVDTRITRHLVTG
jgi:hypothetical protein